MTTITMYCPHCGQELSFLGVDDQSRAFYSCYWMTTCTVSTGWEDHRVAREVNRAKERLCDSMRAKGHNPDQTDWGRIRFTTNLSDLREKSTSVIGRFVYRLRGDRLVPINERDDSLVLPEEAFQGGVWDPAKARKVEESKMPN